MLSTCPRTPAAAGLLVASWNPSCRPHPWPWSAPQGGATSRCPTSKDDRPVRPCVSREGRGLGGGGQVVESLAWKGPSRLPPMAAASCFPPPHPQTSLAHSMTQVAPEPRAGLLTFEQGQWDEFLLVALIAELRGAVGPPGPGPAEGTAGEAVHLVGWGHRGQPWGRGAAGGARGGQLRLHGGQAVGQAFRAPELPSGPAGRCVRLG